MTEVDKVKAWLKHAREQQKLLATMCLQAEQLIYDCQRLDFHRRKRKSQRRRNETFHYET
jgi:hypothetical protein